MAPNKSRLNNKKSLHQARLNFIIACLDNSVIPKGLEIEKVPLVAARRTCSQRPSSDEIEQYIKRDFSITSQTSELKHLKSYYKSILIHLKDEIMKEQAIFNN